MKNQAIIMEKASLKPFLLVFICCLALTGSVGTAKSLYLAGNSPYVGLDLLWAYDVQPDGRIVFQAESSYHDGGSLGVNGLDLDPDSNALLITYTGFSEAGAADSESLEFEKFIYLVPWDMHAGGISYDETRSRVYVTDDDEARLIIYDWIAETQELHNIGYGVSEVRLKNTNAGPLAFDPDKELVYVPWMDSGIEVLKTAFDLADWQHVRVIDSAYEVQALSVDSRNQYLYTGGSTTQGAVITRRNLATGTETQTVAAGPSEAMSILSLCVDNATSLLYALIGHPSAPTRDIRVYDSAFNVIQTVTLTGDALALHIPSSSVGYNPLNVTITPTSGAVKNNDLYVAAPGSEIYYEICMSNTNLFPATEIIGTDTLPAELDFVRAEGLGDALGVYDALSRTYFYSNLSLDPNSTECFTLVARVREDAVPGTLITNSFLVDSNETAQSGASVDIEVGYNTLGLTKTVVMDPNFLQIGHTIYVDPGANVTYQICVSNLNNQNPVSNVLVIDQLPESVDFVSAEQAGLISHYDADTHSYSWAFDIVEPNYLNCFDITVRVRDDIPPGQLISNEVLLGGADAETVTTHSDVVVKYGQLAVNIDIANTGDYNPVTNQVLPGGILTYIIDVNNLDPLYPAQEVIFVDSIPEGLQFVGANPPLDNGVYDPLSRTYTYQQPFVGPLQGIHTELTFIVADNLPGNSVLTNSVIARANGAPASADSVSVSVYDPDMTYVPTTLDLFYTGPLLRQDHAESIMAVMRLPDPITMDDIDTSQVLIMTPGLSPAFYIDSVEGIPTIYYMYIGYDGSLNVKGFFDRQRVLDALFPGQESVTITVTGSLKSGRQFVGQATVPVN